MNKIKEFFKKIFSPMNVIIIDGERIEVKGNKIRIENDKLYVDDVLIKSKLNNEVHVKFEGDLANLDCNTCTVTGNVEGCVDANRVSCGDVGGSIDANTVNCGNVEGNIDANTVNRK